MFLLENMRYQQSLSRMLARAALDLIGRTIIITGATGMLGSCLVDALMLWNRRQDIPCRVIAVGRSTERAKARFGAYWTEKTFSFCEQDVCMPAQNLPEKCDYIIHAASHADPVHMAADPVHTLLANVAGTDHLLRYGLSHGMKRFLYVSSGEVYGQPDEKLSDFAEEYCGPVDLSNPRSCYPEGKRAAEVLCQSYISQYGVDAVIMRPCHLFGPTMTGTDSRAVSEFLRNAAAGRDIVLKSAGLLERSHCYVVDAVQAVLLVLTKGECGKTYNIADRRYQMPVRDFARRAAEAGDCQVVFEMPSELEKEGYSRVRRAVLDTTRLEALGWLPGNQNAIETTTAILRECGLEKTHE